MNIVGIKEKKKNDFQDIETFDLEDFKYNSVNMTAFRLVDLEEPKVAEVLRQMERFQPIGHAILNKTGVIQVGGKFKLLRGVCSTAGSRYRPQNSLHPSPLKWKTVFYVSVERSRANFKKEQSMPDILYGSLLIYIV